MTLRFALYLLFAAVLTSCNEPLEHSCFRNVESLDGWRADDTISLSLDLRKDNFPATLQLSAEAMEDAMGQDITLYLSFVSPDNHIYRDSATFKFELSEGGNLQKKGRTVQILWPYMHIDKLNTEGKWKILLQRSKEDKEVYSKISGMGVSVSK